MDPLQEFRLRAGETGREVLVAGEPLLEHVEHVPVRREALAFGGGAERLLQLRADLQYECQDGAPPLKSRLPDPTKHRRNDRGRDPPPVCQPLRVGGSVLHARCWLSS
jgi:hypothetical protein